MQKLDLNLLHYRDSGCWLPLPAWANFFIGLGEKLAERRAKSKRWTMALSLPTKAYIAPFIGIGVLSYCFRESSLEELLEEYFQMLASLDKCTLVWYKKNDRIIKARFLGVTEYQGELRLLIQTQSSKAGGLTEYVSKKNALDIQISQNQTFRLPKNQRGRSIVMESIFVDTLFDIQYRELLKYSDTKVCFIGIRGQLENETINTPYAVPKGYEFVKGTLNDVLRIRQFQHSMESYHSEFLSSLARKNELESQQNPETIVIYCGSNGYLNWNKEFRNSNVVVLLDRSEPQFELAVKEIINRHVQSNRLPSSGLDLEKIPGGIELLFWEEMR